MNSTNTSQTRTEKLLLEAARSFNATIDYEELIQIVLRLVLTAVNSEVALVFRVDHKRTDMKIRFMTHYDCKMNIIHRELGQGLIGWVAKYREPVIINNGASDPRVDRELGKLTGFETRSLLSVPLIGKGQMIGVIEAINRCEGEFTSDDLDILTGLSNQIAVAIDNANLYRKLKQEALEKDQLYEIGKKLSGSLSLDELLAEILSSVKRVVDYDAAGVFLVDAESGEVDSIASAGFNPEDVKQLHLKLGHGLVGHVAKSGQPTIVSNVADDDRYVTGRPGVKSEIVVPITFDDKVVGVLDIESDKINAFTMHDQDLLTTFATHAAVSIERARMHQQLLAGRKIIEELNIAREIQTTFLPKADPEIEGYDISGKNIPSEQVGGDYFDFIEILENQTGIAIADVSGKGIPAALIMASYRASLIAEIRNNYSIRTICHKVNNLMCESVSSGNFVTAVYGVLDSKNHIITFANCGHNQPVLVRANGEVIYLKEGGVIMGVTVDATYEEKPLFLNSGDIVFLYTDGVSEVFDSQGEEFGLDRLIEILRAHKDKSAAEIQDIVFAEVRSFAGDGHTFDDFTSIVLKRL